MCSKFLWSLQARCASLQICVHCLEAFCSRVPLGQDPQLLGERVNEAGGKQAVLETPGNMRTSHHPTGIGTYPTGIAT